MSVFSEIRNSYEELKRMRKRLLLHQLLNFGLVVASALMIWKAMCYFTASESPIVVVLSGSMEPALQRGDLLFLYQSDEPFNIGDICVFNNGPAAIPIVHRIQRQHVKNQTHPLNSLGHEVDLLTKGDNNPVDDRQLYPVGQQWLRREHVVGRAFTFIPYVGMVTIVMNEYPLFKWVVIGFLCLMMVLGKDS